MARGSNACIDHKKSVASQTRKPTLIGVWGKIDLISDPLTNDSDICFNISTRT